MSSILDFRTVSSPYHSADRVLESLRVAGVTVMFVVRLEVDIYEVRARIEERIRNKNK